MSSFWESKYLSSEKSVQFLQQTHSEILKGLHEEIDNLQKQCSDYALRLSMRASTEVEKEEFDQKFKSFNLEYKKKDDLIADQQELINERNKNIKNLTDRIKSLEKRLEIDSNPKDLIIKQLKKELEIKSAQVAHLTYQLHNAHKAHKPQKAIPDPKESSTYISNPNLTDTARIVSPGRKKKSNRNSMSRYESEKDEMVLENQSLLNHPSKASIPNMNERRMSSDSIVYEPNNLNENSGFVSKGGANSLKTYTQQRLTNSMSSTYSANSDRSEAAYIADLKNKLLPPVVKRSFDSVPDPKPFLQSMSSTLHSRSKKELLQRRALIALPQIKPYENMMHQLAVESPLKSVSHHGQHLDHNNSSAN